jgi:L-cystine uptake protein TcyP (sodium:dicarboxylate symporter family)
MVLRIVFVQSNSHTRVEGLALPLIQLMPINLKIQFVMHSVLVTEHGYNRQMYARCMVGTLQYNVTFRYIEQT